MTPAPLHVVFTPSGASSLREALEDAGREDQVVSLFDCLSFGPINPPDLSLRSKWVEDELGWTGWNDIALKTEAFWREALSPGGRKIAWLSRRSAKEYAGFLEWLWRMGDDVCEIVDLTDVKMSRRPAHGPPTPAFLAVSLGGLFPDEIAGNDLLSHARLLTATERNEYQSLWARLRMENAPLRVLTHGSLISAPISTFDAQLMSYVTNDWQKVAMIVGLTFASQMDDHVFQAGDILLAARLDALAENGHLEMQGKSALEMHASLVRLPQQQIEATKGRTS